MTCIDKASYGSSPACIPRKRYLYSSFSTKEPYTWWLFCRKRPATEGMLWVFAHLYPKQCGGYLLVSCFVFYPPPPYPPPPPPYLSPPPPRRWSPPWRGSPRGSPRGRVSAPSSPLRGRMRKHAGCLKNMQECVRREERDRERDSVCVCVGVQTQRRSMAKAGLSFPCVPFFLFSVFFLPCLLSLAIYRLGNILPRFFLVMPVVVCSCYSFYYNTRI